jgi:hypothetical protein
LHPVGRRADHGDAGLGVEQRAKPGARESIAVCHQDADRGTGARVTGTGGPDQHEVPLATHAAGGLSRIEEALGHRLSDLVCGRPLQLAARKAVEAYLVMISAITSE